MGPDAEGWLRLVAILEARERAAAAARAVAVLEGLEPARAIDWGEGLDVESEEDPAAIAAAEDLASGPPAPRPGRRPRRYQDPRRGRHRRRRR